ncbi:MAG: hypothetical protein JKY44_04725 [Flavobacteriaceae bacterium]|nr:hypothetical protein [Flavobacteriaceae bacterium]
MKLRYTFFLIFLFTFFSNVLTAQEKKSFLQHRFDGFIEIIHKNYTKEKLTALKNDFARIGIDFTFSKLAINNKNEITSITLKLKNNKSSAALTLTMNTGAIPSIKIGETNGIVSISPVDHISPKNRN